MYYVINQVIQELGCLFILETFDCYCELKTILKHGTIKSNKSLCFTFAYDFDTK